MWVKIAKTVVMLVSKDKNARELFVGILGAILLPLIIILALISTVGKSGAMYNISRVKTILQEGNGQSGIDSMNPSFEGEIGESICAIELLWNEKTEITDLMEEDKKALRIFMKSAYYVGYSKGLDLKGEEKQEAFVDVFLEKKKAADIFEELGSIGFSYTPEMRKQVYQIYSVLLNDKQIVMSEDPAGIWNDGDGTQVVIHNAMFGSPFPLDWTKKITSEFGWREHPTKHTRKFHKGVDIGMKQGTPILSCSSGEVITSAYDSSAGNYVRVRTPEGYTIVYMHMVERKAKKGDMVMEGDVLGYVGTTGDSTGPHLHLGVQNPAGEWVNPREYISVPEE